MQEEVWKEFRSGHYISNLGRVKKTKNNKTIWIKSGTKRSPKCSYLSLFIDKEHVYVHNLVAKMFVLNENPDFFTSVLHTNGDTVDNRAENLVWVHPLMLTGRTDIGKDTVGAINQIKIKPMFKAIVNAVNGPKVIGVFDTEDQANIAARRFLKYL